MSAPGSQRAKRAGRRSPTSPGADYASLPLAPSIDLFDAEGANAQLAARQLVYGAGIERFGRPGFFLADLAYEHMRNGACS